MKTSTALSTLIAASVLFAGAATTANAVDGDTSVTVGAPRSLVAGAEAPFDAPGVKAIRQGKAIPAGYVLTGRAITVKAGPGGTGAAIRFTCPSGKALRTFGATGDVGPAIDRKYVGRRAENVMVFGRTGQDAAGAVYAVCR